MSVIRAFAPAKINLYLHVTGRREDGYHLLDSLAVFAAVGDDITAQPAADIRVQIDGPFAAALDAATNSVMAAAAALQSVTGVTRGARIGLCKNLPVAAGLGGGSADAAATLRALETLWNVTAPPELLVSLGADVPVCYHAQAARFSGIGDVLRPAPPLPMMPMVLVNPLKGLLTAEVFRRGAFGHAAPVSLSQEALFLPERMQELSALRNDLEAPAMMILPVIAEIKQALGAQPHCLLARMSGSGATCFAVYETHEAAQRAARGIQHTHPHWWVRETHSL